jgi:hypothetical protein
MVPGVSNHLCPAISKIGFEGQNWFLSKELMGQTDEQQRHFKQWPISELYGELDSIQTSLKPPFYPPAIIECRLCLWAQC